MINLKNCKKKDFLKLVMQKGIICIGAGEGLQNICKWSTYITPYIIGVADNSKAGLEISIDSKKFLIVKPENIGELGIAADKAVFCITSVQYAEEFIEQFNSINIYDGKDIYIFRLLERDDDFYIIPKDRKKIIPKIIHYCWFGKNSIPKQFQDNIDSWKRYCPDYDIVEWNETNYDVTKNLYMKQAYEAKKWGFVPDFARLDIINEHGGFYLDTDVEMVRSFEPLRIYEFCCGFQPDNRVAFGLGFGGVKHNTYTKKHLELYKDLKFKNDDGTFNQTPAPNYTTPYMQRFGFKINGKTQEINGAIIFSEEYFSPFSGTQGVLVGETTPKTFSIHQYSGTWNDNKRAYKTKFIMKKFQKLMTICTCRI